MLVRLIISPPPLRALMYLVTNLLTNVRGVLPGSPVPLPSGYDRAIYVRSSLRQTRVWRRRVAGTGLKMQQQRALKLWKLSLLALVGFHQGQVPARIENNQEITSTNSLVFWHLDLVIKQVKSYLCSLIERFSKMMDAIIKQEVVEKEPREVILTWKEKPKEKSKY